MECNDFKKMFGETAKDNGFEKEFEGWFKEADEVIHVLDLQKSNFGKLYYLNIKLYIHGIFEKKYIRSKKLVKVDVGTILIRQPDNYSYLLNLEKVLPDMDRKKGLQDMFVNYIVPFCEKTSTKRGIIELNKKGELFLMPGVKEPLGIV